MQLLRKSLLYSLWLNLINIVHLNANTKEIATLNSLALNLIKIITLNANTKEIVTLQTVCRLT